MKKLINLNFTGVTRGIPLMKQYRNLFIILTVALFLTACGGGGGTTLSTSSGGGNGGGSTTNPNPPVVQKDIATLVMEAETAVGEIDAVNPTEGQVNKANTAIMAANDAIDALEDGDDKATYMTQLDALRLTVTETAAELAVMAIGPYDEVATQAQVADAQMKIDALTTLAEKVGDEDAEEAAEELQMTVNTAKDFVDAFADARTAVAALGSYPYDKATKDQFDVADMAVAALRILITDSGLLSPEDMGKYIATPGGVLRPILIEVRQFVEADLTTAATAKTTAGTRETDVTSFAAGSPDITAIVDGQTISVAMGVSEDIGTSDDITTDITTINGKIDEIEKQLRLAERAKKNLDDAAGELRKEIFAHNEDLKAALQGTGNPGDSQNEQILEFIAAADQLDREASSIEGRVTDIETTITSLEMDIATESDTTIVARKQAELNDIKTGVTKYDHPVDPQDQTGCQTQCTYADLKDLATTARKDADDKKAEQDKINKLVMNIQTKESVATAKETDAIATQVHIMAIKGVLEPLDTRFGVLRDVDALQSTKAGLVFDLLREPLAGAGGSNTDSPLKAVTNVLADLDVEENHVFARFNNPDEAVTYVDYGMWLEGTDDALMLERRIGVVGPNQAPRNLELDIDGSNTDTNATYRGDAHGLSARTIVTRDDDDVVTTATASGHFIADVELNVEFGAFPELAGTIRNFRAVEGQGSDHVDGTWSLELRGATVAGNAAGNNEFDGRYFRGGSGHWTATPYGATSGERPDGFFGGFNASFQNSDNTDRGAAAGVYSTEKVE